MRVKVASQIVRFTVSSDIPIGLAWETVSRVWNRVQRPVDKPVVFRAKGCLAADLRVRFRCVKR
jgi:hypothetical protein